MTTTLLGEVVEINPRDPSPPKDAYVSFVGMAQLDAGRAVAKPLETRRFGEVSSGYTVFRDGDILAAKITPCWENGKVGQAVLDNEIGVGSTEFHVLRPSAHVEGRYLLHFLRQPAIRLTGEIRMTGSAGQRRVPVRFLETLRFPLVSIDTQRRIADILDKADALRAKRQKVLDNLDALTQSIFHDMFGATDLPEESLADLILSIESGKSVSCEARPAEAAEWGILKLGALSSGRFLQGENKALLEVGDRLERHEVKPGDVLMARKNTLDLVGVVAVVPDNVRPRLLLPDLIYRIELDARRVEPRFFETAMKMPLMRRRIQSIAGGAAASMSNISQARLRSLALPLPPLERQQEFVRRIAIVHDQERNHRLQIDRHDAVRNALGHTAFSGAL